ncbi:MAG: rod shape-determining protein MreD [Salinisphaera sp.]|jgi:rod shape-determining protein MreD|nr:rod shape-determining protein MreD [Salinisphaera sp.]
MIIHRQVGALMIGFTLIISLLLILLPLPATLGALRPAFYTATVLFWVLMQPQRFGLVAAWCAGVMIDVLYGTPLSEHGLAMAVAAYVVIKLRPLLWTFPVIQQAAVMLPIFAIYEFVLFWIDGVAGADVDLWWRWLPVLSSSLVWPAWAFLLERIAEFEVG